MKTFFISLLFAFALVLVQGCSEKTVETPQPTHNEKGMGVGKCGVGMQGKCSVGKCGATLKANGVKCGTGKCGSAKKAAGN